LTDFPLSFDEIYYSTLLFCIRVTFPHPPLQPCFSPARGASFNFSKKIRNDCYSLPFSFHLCPQTGKPVFLFSNLYHFVPLSRVRSSKLIFPFSTQFPDSLSFFRSFFHFFSKHLISVLLEMACLPFFLSEFLINHLCRVRATEEFLQQQAHWKTLAAQGSAGLHQRRLASSALDFTNTICPSKNPGLIVWLAQAAWLVYVQCSPLAMVVKDSMEPPLFYTFFSSIPPRVLSDTDHHQHLY